ncbi:hypothetical protein BDV95DRAFT_602186 [Massariosphaeria phaeospora]|uniref:Uncharacterized protein n=1 Tax=Massariosphaeria phaeospora TaxID=100035 RepID=A0A7C8ICL2_9PLEO|nr:hypothetical protein BDV95DRAFT_602186 [Massariosphaeria phaeospora]
MAENLQTTHYCSQVSLREGTDVKNLIAQLLAVSRGAQPDLTLLLPSRRDNAPNPILVVIHLIQTYCAKVLSHRIPAAIILFQHTSASIWRFCFEATSPGSILAINGASRHFASEKRVANRDLLRVDSQCIQETSNKKLRGKTSRGTTQEAHSFFSVTSVKAKNAPRWKEEAASPSASPPVSTESHDTAQKEG